MLPGKRDAWRGDPRIGIQVLVAGAAFAGFLALGGAILLAPALVRLDVAVSSAIRSLSLPGLHALAVVATTLGGFWPVAVLTGATAGVLWWRGRRIEAVFILVAVFGGELVGVAFKEVFMRVRPAIEGTRIPMPESYSFPSGHALAGMLYFASLAFVTLIDERRLRISVAVVAGCVAAAITIALSRVYLGVHYLGDIVGAWLLGSAWLALVALVFARFAAGDPTADATGPDEGGR